MDDGDEIHSRRPRQCCPYAVVQYSITCSQSLYKDLPMWNYSNTVSYEIADSSQFIANNVLKLDVLDKKINVFVKFLFHHITAR